MFPSLILHPQNHIAAQKPIIAHSWESLWCWQSIEKSLKPITFPWNLFFQSLPHQQNYIRNYHHPHLHHRYHHHHCRLFFLPEVSTGVDEGLPQEISRQLAPSSSFYKMFVVQNDAWQRLEHFLIHSLISGWARIGGRLIVCRGPLLAAAPTDVFIHEKCRKKEISAILRHMKRTLSM